MKGDTDRLLSRVRLFATHGLYVDCQAPCPWDSPGKNTGVGICSLLQGIFPGIEPRPRELQADSFRLSQSNQNLSCKCLKVTELKPKGVCVCARTLSCSDISNSLWPSWTVAHQTLLSMGIFQARTLEWVAIPSSRRSSQPRDWTQVSCIAGEFFIDWAITEAQEYWSGLPMSSLGVFPTQESNWGLLNCRWILYQLSFQGSHRQVTTQGNYCAISLMDDRRQHPIQYPCNSAPWMLPLSHLTWEKTKAPDPDVTCPALRSQALQTWDFTPYLLVVSYKRRTRTELPGGCSEFQ